MRCVDRDVASAAALTQCDGPLYGQHSTVFMFTTENIKDTNGILRFKDKKVLVPASSGDQYLGATYYGAKKVDLFDINRLTKYMTYLKISAIRRLSYEEFFQFFLPKVNGKVNNQFFNCRIMQKLLIDLPGDVAEFWDKISRLSSIVGMGGIVRMSSPVNHFGVIKRGMPFYNNPDAYYELQKKLLARNYTYPEFFEADVLKLSDVITDEYDVVYLSNIISCLAAENLDKCANIFQSAITKNNNQSRVLSKIGPHLSKVLKDDGIALISYAGNCRKSMLRDVLFTNPYFDSREIPCKVPGVYSDYGVETDVVLTYRPKNGRFY